MMMVIIVIITISIIVIMIIKDDKVERKLKKNGKLRKRDREKKITQNYMKLYIESDHTDPSVQTRWFVLNQK